MVFLGIDVGGTMTKAALFDEKGRQLACCAEDTPQITPQPGWVERDPDALWHTAARCVRGAIEKANVSAREIAAVGCTGHGKGLYLWDERGFASAAIASTDHRAEKIVLEWEKNGVSKDAAKLSLQRVRDCQPAALLKWYKEERPEVYRHVRWVLEAKDYLRFRLTGTAKAEYTDYSGTSLMNLRTRAFDPELLRLFGIEEIASALPEPCFSYEQCGVVTEEAARETGLITGTPVAGGMFDIDACAIAVGVTGENLLCMVTGTWSINEYVASAPASGSPTTLNSLFCLPGKYLIEESSPTSVGNLEWLVRAAFGEDKSYFAEADRLVEALPPEDSRTIFLPFLYGSNRENVADAAICGLSSGQDRAHLLRALFEGAAFSHRMHVDRLRRLNPALSRVRLTGGAVRSRVWTQLFADVIGLPTEVVRATETGAKGAAMAASCAVGAFDDYDACVHDMVKISETVTPDETKRAIYEEKYQRYLRFLNALAAMEES